jgi:GNAT superfamily N-acetyltransferase
MELKRLIDRNRLPEVYMLRVSAYEESPYSMYINRQLYPQGYYDDLDTLDSTYHWIVEDDDKILGAVRIAIINTKELIKEDLSNLKFPEETPFAYCGRTAVHPDYRKTNIMRQLDQTVLAFLKENGSVKFGFCFVTPSRVGAVKRLGFESAGISHYDWGNGNKSILEAFIWKPSK